MTFSNTNPKMLSLAEIRREAYDKGYADGSLSVTSELIKSSEAYEKAGDDCIKIVHDYFKAQIDNNPDWELDSIDDFALIPNSCICRELEQLKEQNND